jgi:nucleoid DNA-binding protein
MTAECSGQFYRSKLRGIEPGLIEAIATKNGFQKKRSIEIVETLLGIIKSSLASGEDVLISGFEIKGEIKGDDGEKLTYLPFKTATFIHAPGRKHARAFPSTRLFVRAAAAC